MKRSFGIDLLAMLLLFCILFSACAPAPDQSAEQSIDERTDVDLSAIYPDVTGTLHLDITLETSQIMRQAVELFRTMYPNVELVLNEYLTTEESAAYREALPSDLMSGKASDLILFDCTTFPDLHKTMDASVFADLDPYFAADESFHMENYQQSMMVDSLYRGQRFSVPLGYTTAVFMTTEEALTRSGFLWREGMNFSGFAEILCAHMEKTQDKTEERVMLSLLYSEFYPYCGIEILDYENQTVSVDTEAFRELMELSRAGEAYLQSRTPAMYLTYSPDPILAGERIFTQSYWGETTVIQDYLTLLSMESPILFALPAVEDALPGAEAFYQAAIPKTSEQKDLAYAFLKILLSYEVQSTYGNSTVLMIPVHNEARAERINLSIDLWCQTVLQDTGVDYAEHFTPKVRQQFVDVFSNVRFLKNYARAQNNFIFEAMLPYIMGEASYETCLETLENQLTLYILE